MDSVAEIMVVQRGSTGLEALAGEDWHTVKGCSAGLEALAGEDWHTVKGWGIPITG